MLTQLTKHVYCHPCEDQGDRPNIGYIVGDKGALLFEAGNSPVHAAAIRAEIAAAGLPQPGYVVLSHWHWDHSFALHTWDAVTIAGKRTNDQLRVMAGWKWDIPAMEARVAAGEEIRFCHEMILQEYDDLGDITVCPAQVEFDGCLTIDLGGVSCRMLRVEGPHSEDSVVCLVEEDQFLFLGDSDSKDLYGLPWEYDPARPEDLVPAIAALPFDPEKLAKFKAILTPLDFTRCVDGHTPVMTRGELFERLV